MRKFRIKLAVLSLLFCALTTPASARHVYDHTTGNSYFVHEDESGTRVRGYNLNNGTSWSSRTDNDGVTRGIDSNSNTWRYDAKNNNYYNSDGTMCVGKGHARLCN